jgi:SP family arabinose:H+ symporter-like MFS transporter
MNTPRTESRFLIFHASIVAALGGLLFGYDTAVIAGTVDLLQTRFDLGDFALGWTVSSAVIGCVFGA